MYDLQEAKEKSLLKLGVMLILLGGSTYIMYKLASNIKSEIDLWFV